MAFCCGVPAFGSVAGLGSLAGAAVVPKAQPILAAPAWQNGAHIAELCRHRFVFVPIAVGIQIPTGAAGAANGHRAKATHRGRAA